MCGGIAGITELSENKLDLVDYSRTFLDLSWEWLTDPEIRSLTMTPDFSREDQIRFFESLENRDGYDIWGVALGAEPIGAAGLKNQREGVAEYWGYIGKRELWGQGLGKSLVTEVESKARSLGFSALDLKVSTANQRAIALYCRMGFEPIPESMESEVVTMVKKIV